jgi:hypothetical protein
VRDGQPSSPFKKKKKEERRGNYFSTNHLLAKMSEAASGAPRQFFLLSQATAPICPPFGPPQKRGQGVEIRKNGGH